MQRKILALVVGSVSRDLESSRRDEGFRPGGVVHYGGATLARLGAQTRVVASAHPDDASTLLAPLLAEGVETHVVPTKTTTTYVNDYSGQVDGHELLSASEPIRASDVPASWRSSDVIQLGPLHPLDLDSDLPRSLSGRIGLDVQGLVRQPGGPGRLAPYPNLDPLLENVDVLQASEAELETLLDGEPLERFRDRHRIAELVITRGPRGATLLCGHERNEISARPAHGSHRVGAGDVFLASYLFLREIGRDPHVAAQGAAELCALKIDAGEVPKGFPTEGA